jgi:hypothetical protein
LEICYYYSKFKRGKLTMKVLTVRPEILDEFMHQEKDLDRNTGYM